MPTLTTRDGTQIYYKDWGSGSPIVFSHGWPLSSDSWEAQMLFLASNGFRCIAHDRRGHGRSSQPWAGNEMDTYADDLATVIDTLNLTNAFLVGFSTGGGEVARYIGRHGTARVAKAALVSAVPPLMLKTAAKIGRSTKKRGRISAPFFCDANEPQQELTHYVRTHLSRRSRHHRHRRFLRRAGIRNARGGAHENRTRI